MATAKHSVKNAIAARRIAAPVTDQQATRAEPAPQPQPDTPPVVDAVVIGRNEGARLMACLASLKGQVRRIVYVDSGSRDGSQSLAARLGVPAVFAAAWGAWVPLGAVFLYRTVTYTYRLTDRALVLDFGFWFRPVPPVSLAEVTDVRAGAGVLGRVLGVGWLEVRTANRVVRLVGVRRPGAAAERIRAAVAAGRNGRAREEAEQR